MNRLSFKMPDLSILNIFPRETVPTTNSNGGDSTRKLTSFTKKRKVTRKLRKDEKKLLAKTRAGNRSHNNKGRSH